jgi:hypothetical protein
VARHLSRFVATLFRVDTGRQLLLDVAAREQAIFRCKEFIVRRAIKKYAADAVTTDDPAAITRQAHAVAARILGGAVDPADPGLTLGRAVAALLDREKALDGALEQITTATSERDVWGARLQERRGAAGKMQPEKSKRFSLTSRITVASMSAAASSR